MDNELAIELQTAGISGPTARVIEAQIVANTGNVEQLVASGIPTGVAKLLAQLITADAGILDDKLVHAGLNFSVVNILKRWMNGAPRVVSAPVIAGVPEVGLTVTSDGGEATGPGVTTRTFAWYQDDVVIAGQTTSSLENDEAYLGKVITTSCTYTNAFGSVGPVFSAPFGPIVVGVGGL